MTASSVGLHRAAKSNYRERVSDKRKRSVCHLKCCTVGKRQTPGNRQHVKQPPDDREICPPWQSVDPIRIELDPVRRVGCGGQEILPSETVKSTVRPGQTGSGKADRKDAGDPSRHGAAVAGCGQPTRGPTRPRRSEVVDGHTTS